MASLSSVVLAHGHTKCGPFERATGNRDDGDVLRVDQGQAREERDREDRQDGGDGEQVRVEAAGLRLSDALGLVPLRRVELHELLAHGLGVEDTEDRDEQRDEHHAQLEPGHDLPLSALRAHLQENN